MPPEKFLNIGRVAALAGVSSDTIRYYERRGIIPPPRRSPSSYRRYDSATVDRLRFVKRAQALGFSLDEIRDLLDLRADQAATCRRVNAATREKVAEIDQKIHELTRIRDVLSDLASACCADAPLRQCPVLAALSSEEPGR